MRLRDAGPEMTASATGPIVLIPGLGVEAVRPEADASPEAGALTEGPSPSGSNPVSFPVEAWTEALLGRLAYPCPVTRDRSRVELTRDFEGNPFAGAVAAALPRHRNAGLLTLLRYDWRNDITKEASLLEEQLLALSQDLGGRPIDLVCHGTGGLLARYYVESGKFSSARPLVRRLVLLGVPHHGIPAAFRALVDVLRRRPKPDEAVRNLLLSVPAIVQLIPPPRVPFVYPVGDPLLKVNPFAAPKLWSGLLTQTGSVPDAGGAGISENTLARMGELNQSLHSGLKEYTHVFWRNSICFVGSGFETLLGYPVHLEGGEYKPAPVDPHPHAGDGVVPWSSAFLYPSVRHEVIEARHDDLFRHPSFLDHLARLF